MHKQQVYGLLCATYVAIFHCFCWKFLVRAIQVHFGSYLYDYMGSLQEILHPPLCISRIEYCTKMKVSSTNTSCMTICSLCMQLLLLEGGESASERINIQPPVPPVPYPPKKITPHLFSAVDMAQIKERVYFQTWTMHLKYKPTTSR